MSSSSFRLLPRTTGADVRRRIYHSQWRDLRLMALTHNVMILLGVESFYGALASLLIILVEY